MHFPPALQSDRNKAGWPSRRWLGDAGPESGKRQEREMGPQTEQLRMSPGQILQDEKEELEPCPDRRPHMSYSRHQGDLSNYTNTDKVPWR